MQDFIEIYGATENNLKHVSLKIPKKQITVVTGVSGSGKSSLVLDTIAAKSRRELNDTFPSFVQQYLPKYGRPHVEHIENLPIAIVIEQRKPASNSRSTVGTYTDIYSLLRLLFSRIGQPFVGYSDVFSFNHPMGSCPRCSGLGEIRELDIHKLVDFNKSLNDEDTIHYIAFGKGGWRWIRYAHSGLFDLDKKIKDYSPEELEFILKNGSPFDLIQVPFNIFDKKFLPYMKELHDKGVEIHVRSTFLQGLFFKDRNALSEKLKPMKKYLLQLDEFSKESGLNISA